MSGQGAEKDARCPEPWCAYPMPHGHPVETLSAAPPRPTFTEVLNDPAQQLDPDGVVLQAVLSHDDALRAEGWQACVDYIWRHYHGMLSGEDTYWAGRHNPFLTRVTPPADPEDGGESDE